MEKALKKTVKKRKSHINRKRGGKGFVLLAVLIAVALAVTVFLLAKIRNITVSASERYTAEEIIECSGLKTGDGILFINESEIVSAIKEKYSYAEKVEVKRDYFQLSVTVVITDAKEAVCVSLQEGYAVIDENGKVLDIKATKPNLPELIGSGITEAETGKKAVFRDETTERIYKNVWEELINAELADKISELNVSKRYNITFDYMAKIMINLGNADNVEKKIKAAMICVSDNADKDEKAEIKFQDDTAKQTIYHPLTDEEWIDIKLKG